MFNTKMLLVAIAILVLGGGIYFFSTGNIPTAGNQLTRVEAESMIWESVKGNLATRSMVYGYGGFTMYYQEAGMRADMIELEKQGLIKIVGDYGAGDEKVIELT